MEPLFEVFPLSLIGSASPNEMLMFGIFLTVFFSFAGSILFAIAEAASEEESNNDEHERNSATGKRMGVALGLLLGAIFLFFVNLIFSMPYYASLSLSIIVLILFLWSSYLVFQCSKITQDNTSETSES